MLHARAMIIDDFKEEERHERSVEKAAKNIPDRYPQKCLAVVPERSL